MRYAMMVAGGLAAALLLSGCGSSNAPRQMPQMPVDGLLDKASLPAFRNADHQSFAQAVLRIPADGGTHVVPVGEYLLGRVAEAFPPNAEVDNLRLTRWEVRCNDEGWFSSTLVCDVTSDFAFRLYKRPERMAIALKAQEFGGLAKAKTPGYTVARPDAGVDDPFADQIRAIPDAVATRMKADLPPVLLAAQRRMAF